MSRQLTFDLPLTEAYRADNYFIAGSNAVAHAQVLGGAWPQGKLLLIGPNGAGKSHLAHLWAQATGAQVVPARDLLAVDLAGLPARLVVEDAGMVAGLPPAEEALFHLWNRRGADDGSGGHLLITAACSPRDWGLALPDLLSRMQAMAQARLDAPDDALLAAVLVKLFDDRQVHVPPNLIAYLVTRIERSVSGARAVVAILDARSLAQGRPITRAMAAEVLETATGPDGAPA